MAKKKQAATLELFFSYSHKDEKLRDKLENHLSNLKRQNVVTGWHDRKITPGREWSGVIDMNLEAAHVILLLVSADFLASDYCYDVEMNRALARHKEGRARVIPIILRPCDWKSAPFGKLQVLPRNAKPVTQWNTQDEALFDIAAGIRSVAEEMARTPKLDKNQLSDEDLYHLAEKDDDEAYEILTFRLRYLTALIKNWCIEFKVPISESIRIAQNTINEAVSEVRQSKQVPPEEERPGWLEEIAKREFERWVRASYPDLDIPPSQNRKVRPTFTPEQNKIRRRNEHEARKKLDWITGDEREILERVLGLDQDLEEEAGPQIPVQGPEAAQKLFLNALKKLMNIIDEYYD